MIKYKNIEKAGTSEFSEWLNGFVIRHEGLSKKLGNFDSQESSGRVKQKFKGWLKRALKEDAEILDDLSTR